MSRLNSSLALSAAWSWWTRFCDDLVVEVLDAERLLDLLDALLGGRDGALLLVDVVVDVALEAPDDAGELVVELGRVGDPAAR